jgi:hypothetical protein
MLVNLMRPFLSPDAAAVPVCLSIQTQVASSVHITQHNKYSLTALSMKFSNSISMRISLYL